MNPTTKISQLPVVTSAIDNDYIVIDTYPITSNSSSIITRANLLNGSSFPISDKGGQYYNVKAYGATGNGTTDDTAAINTAIAAMPTGASTLYFPNGNYKISSAITVPNYTKVQGASVQGTLITQTSTTVGVFTAIDSLYVSIQDMKLNGPASGTGVGINFVQSALVTGYLTLRNLEIANFGSHGVYVQTVIVSSFDKVISQNNGGHGFYINNGTSLSMNACYGLSCVQAGYYLSSLVYCSLTGCATDKCGTGYLMDACSGISLNGCGCESTVDSNVTYPGDAFKIQDSSDTIGIHNCWNYANLAHSFWVTGDSTNITLDGVKESTPTGSAIASIQVDSGSDAFLSNYVVTTAMSINGGVTYRDGTNNRLGIGILPGVPLDVEVSGSTTLIRGTSNTSSGTNTQPIYLARGVDTGTKGFGSLVTSTDAVDRFAINLDGTQSWGDGTDSRDTNLYRASSGLLKTDDNLEVLGQLGVGTAPISTHKFDIVSGTAGILSTFTRSTTSDTTPIVEFFAGDTSTAQVIGVSVLTDTVNRFAIDPAGKHAWGTGSTTRDTDLYRLAAGTLKSDGGFATAITTQSGAYSVLGTDSVILTSGTFTITLPSAIGIAGRTYTIKKTDSGTTTTIATTSAQTIDGATTQTITTQYNYFVVVSDNANWWIV